MAVNKNFVVKNGLEVNSNLLVADLDTQTVGIGTTIAPHELHVVGGIGVTNLLVTGVATIANLRVTGPSTFVGVTTFTDNNVFIDKSLFVNGINITGGSGGSIGTDLVVQRHVRAGGIVTFSDSLFVGSGLGQSTGTLGQVLQVAGVSSDAYIGGTLGIGTTNPQDLALHVVGDTRFVGVNTFQGDVVVTGNLDVTGDITYDEITGRNLNISGLATFQTLTAGRVALVGTGDTLTDDANLTFVKGGGQLVVGVGATVGGGLTASSVMVEDLTNNRVVIAGTDGELEDSSNFVFDGSQLILGVGATVGGALTVAGATDLNGALDITGESNFSSGVGIADSIFHIGDDNTQIRFPSADTFKVQTGGTDRLTIGPTGVATFSGAIDANNGIDASTAKVEDLTSGRVVLAGTGGELEDSGNLTFDGTQLVVTGVATVSGAMTAGSFSVGNNQVISSARQLQNIASLDSTTTATIESAIANAPNTFDDIEVTGIATFKSTVKVEDLAPNRVVFVGAGDSLTDDTNFTFDRSQLILGVGATVGGALTVAGATDLNGALDVTGETNFSSGVGIADSIFHIGDDNTQIRFPAADTFTVQTGGTERIRVTSAGLVGLGTDDPDNFNPNADDLVISGLGHQGLTIRSGTAHDGSIMFNDTTDANQRGIIRYDHTTDAMAFHTSGGETLRMTSGSDVGIGTTNPERRLEIHDTAATVLQLNSTNANGTSLRIQHNKTDKTFVGLAGDFITGQGSNVTDSAVRASGALLFATGGGNERVRITGIGSVGIGTVAPEHAFVVRDDGLARIRIRNDSNAANSFCSYNLKTRNGEWSMYADGSSGSDDYLKIFRAGSGTHLYFYESADKIGINSAICQVDINGNTLGDSKFGFLTSETNTGFHVQTNGERTLKVNGDGLISSGIITATDGFALGIHSAGTSVVSGPIKTLNFVGSGNTFAYNASTDTIDISIAGDSGGGGGSGVTETDTTVSTVNPTGVGSFATASFRSASVIAQINQLNTDFQVGRYLMIHDGTTVTVVEESAVSTGSTMLGSFTGVIDGSNVELRVTLASAGVSTVTTKIDTVTV